MTSHYQRYLRLDDAKKQLKSPAQCAAFADGGQCEHQGVDECLFVHTNAAAALNATASERRQLLLPFSGDAAVGSAAAAAAALAGQAREPLAFAIVKPATLRSGGAAAAAAALLDWDDDELPPVSPKPAAISLHSPEPHAPPPAEGMPSAVIGMEADGGIGIGIGIGMEADGLVNPEAPRRSSSYDPPNMRSPDRDRDRGRDRGRDRDRDRRQDRRGRADQDLDGYTERSREHRQERNSDRARRGRAEHGAGRERDGGRRWRSPPRSRSPYRSRSPPHGGHRR